MSNDGVRALVESALDSAPTYSIFVWNRVTPSVRAGRRYPATRKPDGSFVTPEISTPDSYQRADLEIVNRAGERVALWSAAFHRHLWEGDSVRFEPPGWTPPA